MLLSAADAPALLRTAARLVSHLTAPATPTAPTATRRCHLHPGPRAHHPAVAAGGGRDRHRAVRRAAADRRRVARTGRPGTDRATVPRPGHSASRHGPTVRRRATRLSARARGLPAGLRRVRRRCRPALEDPACPFGRGLPGRGVDAHRAGPAGVVRAAVRRGAGPRGTRHRGDGGGRTQPRRDHSPVLRGWPRARQRRPLRHRPRRGPAVLPARRDARRRARRTAGDGVDRALRPAARHRCRQRAGQLRRRR